MEFRRVLFRSPWLRGNKRRPPRRGECTAGRWAHPRLPGRASGMSATPGLAAWHAYMAGGSDPQALRALLAENAVFHSPVVHTPQQGRDTVFAYLHAGSHSSEEHTSELQSLMRTAYAVFCLKKKNI